jgi:predicted nucleotidyltransferase component of viral defense system
MRIPLFNRLKKRLHVDIALLQDEVVDVVYSLNPEAVLHGGTAIWRCYAGNRFSEDLDFYISENEKFKKAFEQALNSRGLQLCKYKKTSNSIFSKVSNGSVEVRFEASFRKPKRIEARPFERADGTIMSVFTLSPEALLLEKAMAYSNRGLVRDIYDVFILSTIASLDKPNSQKVLSLVQRAGRPYDEKSLKVIVFSGAVPSFDQMLFALQRRLRK